LRPKAVTTDFESLPLRIRVASFNGNSEVLMYAHPRDVNQLPEPETKIQKVMGQKAVSGDQSTSLDGCSWNMLIGTR